MNKPFAESDGKLTCAASERQRGEGGREVSKHYCTIVKVVPCQRCVSHAEGQREAELDL